MIAEETLEHFNSSSRKGERKRNSLNLATKNSEGVVTVKKEKIFGGKNSWEGEKNVTAYSSVGWGMTNDFSSYLKVVGEGGGGGG